MFSTDAEFEDEVRRIARLLWPAAEFGGAQMVEGRERDGIFESDDFVHCIECTVSRQKDKASDDGAKLEKLIKKLAARYPTKFIKGWFITLDEPTADQRSVLTKYQSRIVPCSYDQFRAKLVDARSYVSLRQKYPFGSVRDPSSGSTSFDLKYIPIELLDDSAAPHDVDSVAHRLLNGGRVVLTGDYGAGKSSTTREIFFALGRRFWQGKTATFPLLLNLRDQHGQTDPVEAIERHARLVGFQTPSSLVRAWRAGYCVPLLDGFDEIASAGWAGTTKKLRDLRYRSMELIRTFLRETPSSSGLLLAGREHFFDSDSELRQALTINNQFLRLHLVEFSSEKVEQFLALLGWNEAVPEWLPTRPLLLAYLVGRGMLTPGATVAASPAVGWHELLDRIAEREAEIEAGIDSFTVRRLIERVATAARSSADGLGPLSADTVIDCFKAVCGYPPDDRGAVLIQRLPGLGRANVEDGSRVLIDHDYAEAARSGDVFQFIPYETALDCKDWQSALRDLGAEIVAYRGQLSGCGTGKVTAALNVANEKQQGDTLTSDILLAKLYMGGETAVERLFLREIIMDSLPLDEFDCDLSLIELQDSVVSTLELGPEAPAQLLPLFRRCHFGIIRGRTGPRDLPAGRFIDCTFGDFENAADTTKAILNLPLPMSTKVLLTILKKLFAQAGSGRRESALVRGLDVRARELVPEVLDLLRRSGFASRSRQGAVTVWLPTRTSGIRRRALAMLGSPSSSPDPLLEASKKL
jgi:hypothetical protein